MTYNIKNIWHGTDTEIKEFKKDNLGVNTGDLSGASYFAFFFTSNKEYAMDYAKYADGDILINANLRIENPYNCYSSMFENMDIDDAEEFINQIKADGYDGLELIAEKFGKEIIEYAVFENDQIEIISTEKF